MASGSAGMGGARGGGGRAGRTGAGRRYTAAQSRRMNQSYRALNRSGRAATGSRQAYPSRWFM